MGSGARKQNTFKLTCMLRICWQSGQNAIFLNLLIKFRSASNNISGARASGKVWFARQSFTKSSKLLNSNCQESYGQSWEIKTGTSFTTCPQSITICSQASSRCQATTAVTSASRTRTQSSSVSMETPRWQLLSRPKITNHSTCLSTQCLSTRTTSVSST